MSVVAAPVKVLIADDQTLFRAALARMLAADARLEVVGQARNGREAVDQVMSRKPDVVLMDLEMPELGGVEAIKLLTQEAPGVRVIVLSAYGEKSRISEAMASGAKGYVDKDVTPEDIVARILAMHSNGHSQVAVEAVALSRRELHVLKQVASGLSNKQIARKLAISHKTVRNHLSRVFRKLEASNRTEAVMNAVRNGLFSA